MQSEKRSNSSRFLLPLFLVAAMIGANSAYGQTHRAAIFKSVFGPNNATIVRPGERVTATILVQNFDDFADSQTIMNIVDMVLHADGVEPFSNLLAATNVVQVGRVQGNGLVITNNLNTAGSPGPGMITLGSSFRVAAPHPQQGGGDFVIVRHTYLVRTNDLTPLVDMAMADGIDNHDGLGGGTPEPISLHIEAQIIVSNPPPVLGAVGDFVWHDINRNGVQDGGEPGVAGVSVQLLDCSGNQVNGISANPVTTPANGRYLFTGVPAGSYQVQFSNLPATFSFTTAGAGGNGCLDSDANQGTGRTTCFNLALGETNLCLDAGLITPLSPGAVGDFVWHDLNRNGVQDGGEPGVSGVSVRLLDCLGNQIGSTLTTPANGRYLFTGLAAGNYQVEFSTLPVGFSFTLPGAGGNACLDSDANTGTGRSACFSLAQGETNLCLDAGLTNAIICNGLIGDFVWLDGNCNGIQDAGEPGLGGLAVDLVNCANPPQTLRTTTTDINGSYSFAGVPAGSYRVRFHLPAGFAFTTPDLFPDQANSDAFPPDGLTQCFQLACDEVLTTVDAGIVPPVDIGDFVWVDDGDGIQNGEPGLPGVQVELLSCTGQSIATTSTDGSGFYLFTGLTPGNYRVRFHAPAGYRFTTPNVGADDSIDSDAVVTGNATVGESACVTLACVGNRTVDAGLIPDNGDVCCVVRAFSDPKFNPGGSDHAVWIPGISTNLVFEPDPGQFIENADGTARLTGTVRSLTNHDAGFVIEVTLSGRTSNPPPGSPKKDLEEDAYVEEGGPVDTDTWHYYTSFSGTLTGFGHYAGGVLQISRTGPAFQVGVGANNKNVNFGGSGWFEFTTTHQPDRGRFPSRGQGDFNYDCIPCPAAPAPVVAPRLISWRVMPSGMTELRIQATRNRSYVVEGSENMINWVPLATLPNTNDVLRFLENDRPSRCYYRLKMLP